MKFWCGVSFVFSAISTCFNAQSICQPNNIVEQKDQTLIEVSVLRSSLDSSPQAMGSLMLRASMSLRYAFALCLKCRWGPNVASAWFPLKAQMPLRNQPDCQMTQSQNQSHATIIQSQEQKIENISKKVRQRPNPSTTETPTHSPVSSRVRT